jgi:hypothetical protein
MTTFYTIDDAESILRIGDAASRVCVRPDGVCVLEVDGEYAGYIWTVQRGVDRLVSDVGLARLRQMVREMKEPEPPEAPIVRASLLKWFLGRLRGLHYCR